MKKLIESELNVLKVMSNVFRFEVRFSSDLIADNYQQFAQNWSSFSCAFDSHFNSQSLI